MAITTKGLVPEPEVIALITLRVTLGGAPGPSLWSDGAEMATDLANALSACPDWDPKELHSFERLGRGWSCVQ